MQNFGVGQTIHEIENVVKKIAATGNRSGQQSWLHRSGKLKYNLLIKVNKASKMRKKIIMPIK